MDHKENLELIRSDLMAHAKTITELVSDQRQLRDMIHQIQIDRAAKVERDLAVTDRLERIEGSLRDLRKVGMWILSAFGATFIASMANFIVRGGLTGG